MSADSSTVLAAGAVLWRPSRRYGVRVALVHRPRYSDWSLPKGKAEPGETMPVAAAREVLEETGFTAVLGRRLLITSYGVATGRKVVHYFGARALDGEFTANREVDKLEWLSPFAARKRMTYAFDRRVLDGFLSGPPDPTTVLLVRHAKAGSRDEFSGNDSDRPLDVKGVRQAGALVGELLPFVPMAVASVPIERCRATVAPLADKLGMPMTSESALGEEAYRDDPAAARRRLLWLADEPLPVPIRSLQPTGGLRSRLFRTDDDFADADRPAFGAHVVCSQGGVIPGVIKSLATRSRVDVPKVGTPKSSYWVLSFDDRKLLQADHYQAPVV